MVVQECSETSDWWRVGNSYTHFITRENISLKHMSVMGALNLLTRLEVV